MLTKLNNIESISTLNIKYSLMEYLVFSVPVNMDRFSVGAKALEEDTVTEELPKCFR